MSIAAVAVDAIVQDAQQTAPLECCGLLIGSREPSTGAIEIFEARRAHNVDPAPARRFLIDPADHFEALRAARESGRDVVGAYHSHPHSPPTASPSDDREASYEEFVYVIAGRLNGEVTLRAYVLAGERLVEVEVEVRRG